VTRVSKKSSLSINTTIAFSSMFSRVWYGFPVQRLIADRVLDFSTRAGSEQGAGSLFEIQITG